MYKRQPLTQVIKELRVDADRGLPAGEAEIRLKEYGPNRLREKKKKSFWKRFSQQLKDYMVIILMIAAAISLAVSYTHLDVYKRQRFSCCSVVRL